MKKRLPFLYEEHRTIVAMLTIYCKAHHDFNGKLCNKCQEMSLYSYARLQNCPFKEHKPTCGNCTVHCHKNNMRTEIKKVMRYSGPRMLLKHPIIAIKHLIHSRRKAPALQNKLTTKHNKTK